MTPLIEILLPTYQRADSLKKNLNHLESEIIQNKLIDEVRILISDNGSNDDTRNIVENFQKQSLIQLLYFRHELNIGLEANMVSILAKATAPYILWTGDDDYFAKGYLSFCIDQIKKNKRVGIIISGAASLHEDGTQTSGRSADFDTKVFEPSYESAWAYSHLAHQMSGLLMKREGLLKAYLEYPSWRNPYLFIFLTTHRLLDSQGVYAPIFQTVITVFNKKDWGYNNVGLLDEVYKSYYPFLSIIGEKNVRNLLLRFTIMHSYRLILDKWKPHGLFSQYKYLVRTTLPLSGFRRKLAIQLIKDYVLTWKNSLESITKMFRNK